ncbi:MAG: type II toxin-antitoxin system YafQ family toxin [Candidatus Kryptoniota bacterium]
MTLSVRRSSKFKKDYKRCLKRSYDIKKLHGTIETLIQGEQLEPRYGDHSLLGEYKDCRECHIEPDWLLIYSLTETELVLIRTGTHADLFE